jgi:hypothetical protein
LSCWRERYLDHFEREDRHPSHNLPLCRHCHLLHQIILCLYLLVIWYQVTLLFFLLFCFDWLFATRDAIVVVFKLWGHSNLLCLRFEELKFPELDDYDRKRKPSHLHQLISYFYRPHPTLLLNLLWLRIWHESLINSLCNRTELDSHLFCDLPSFLLKFTFYLIFFMIFKPNFWQIINASYMCPSYICLYYCSSLFRTQTARVRFLKLPTWAHTIHKLLASHTIPVLVSQQIING